MKPPLPTTIGRYEQGARGVSAQLYEEVRMTLISTGKTLSLHDEISLGFRQSTPAARIARAVYNHDKVPSIAPHIASDGSRYADLIWDPVPDLWTYRRIATDETTLRLSDWWEDDGGTFDRHVLIEDGYMVLNFKVTWEIADETTA